MDNLQLLERRKMHSEFHRNWHCLELQEGLGSSNTKGPEVVDFDWN